MIEPLGANVIVQPDAVEEITKGGIILTKEAQDKPQIGTALAVGPGVYESGKLIPVNVKVGDRIVYGKYAGSEIEIMGTKYLIMRESDIFGKLK